VYWGWLPRPPPSHPTADWTRPLLSWPDAHVVSRELTPFWIFPPFIWDFPPIFWTSSLFCRPPPALYWSAIFVGAVSPPLPPFSVGLDPSFFDVGRMFQGPALGLPAAWNGCWLEKWWNSMSARPFVMPSGEQTAASGSWPWRREGPAAGTGE